MTDGAHAIIYMGMCAVSSRKQRQSQLITICSSRRGRELHVRKEIRLFMIYKRLKACGQSLMTCQRMYCQRISTDVVLIYFRFFVEPVRGGGGCRFARATAAAARLASRSCMRRFILVTRTRVTRNIKTAAAATAEL